MSNRPDTSSPGDPGKEALARARAARAVLREQEALKVKQQQDALIRRRAFFKNTLCRTAVLYTVLNVVYFFVYLAVIFPIKQQPFSDMLQGGTSIIGHAVFFAASLLSAAVYSLILYRHTAKELGPVRRYLTRSCIWFTVVMALCIAAHGIYLDMLYNPYSVTTAGIFLGPSFLLTFAVLLFSFCLTGINGIYRIERFPVAIRAILHVVSVCILIPLTFQLIAHGFSTAADLLVFLVIFVVLYAFAAVFYFSAKGTVRREENNEAEYESMFKKPSDKKSADKES